MRQNDLFKSNTGNHLRVLLYGEQQSYVVNCQRCKMPFPISTPSLLQMEKLPQDMPPLRTSTLSAACLAVLLADLLSTQWSMRTAV